MLDVKLDQWIAKNIPNVNITAFVDDSQRRRQAARRRAHAQGQVRTPTAQSAALPGVDARRRCPTTAPAPSFVGTEDWFNTPGDRPLTLAGLRGHVVLIDFWTYTCINCIRTLPYLEAWDAQVPQQGPEIIGVESPEFPFEHDAGNVAERDQAVRHQLPGRPGQQPRHLERVGQRVLARRLPDRRDRATSATSTFGEGDYTTTEAAIRALLAEAGAKELGGGAQAQRRDRPLERTDHARDLPRHRARRGLGRAASRCSGTHTYARRRATRSRSTSSPTAGPGRSAPSRRSPGRARRSTRTSRARTSTSCSRRRHTASARSRSSVDGRHDARRSTSPGSASTRSPASPTTRATRSTSSSRRGRAATRSRSASGAAAAATIARAMARTSCSLADVGRHRVDQVAERPQPDAALERRGGRGLERHRAARSRSRRSRRACARRERRRGPPRAASSSRSRPLDPRRPGPRQSPRSSSSRLASATAQASGFAM